MTANRALPRTGTRLCRTAKVGRELLRVACIPWLARCLIVPFPVHVHVLVLVLVLVKSLVFQLHRFFVNVNGNRCAVNGNA